jgi:hypothetical protein
MVAADGVQLDWQTRAGDLDELMARVRRALDAQGLMLGKNPEQLVMEESTAALQRVAAEWTRLRGCEEAVTALAVRRAMYHDATAGWDEFVEIFLRQLGDDAIARLMLSWTATEKRAFAERERQSAVLLLDGRRRLRQLRRRGAFHGLESLASEMLGLRLPGQDRRRRRIYQDLEEVEEMARTTRQSAISSGADAEFQLLVIALCRRGPPGPEWFESLAHHLSVARMAYHHGADVNPAWMAPTSETSQDWLNENLV